MKVPLQVFDLENAVGYATPSVAAGAIKAHINQIFGVETSQLTVVHLGITLNDADLVTQDMLKKSADILVVLVAAPEPPQVSQDLVRGLHEAMMRPF